MHSSSSRQVKRLILALLIWANFAAAQAQNVDPDCQAVVGAAAAGRDRTLGSIDAVATATSTAVNRSKGCVDELVNGSLRVIPSFGGGFVDRIAAGLSRNLANSACQMISTAKYTAQRQVSPYTGGVDIFDPRYSQPQPGVLSQTTQPTQAVSSAPASPPPSNPSILQRLGQLF